VRVLSGEGLANHTDPKSCATVQEDRGEASTGERIGWVLSRESSIVQSADAVASAEGNTARDGKRVPGWLCVVGDPSMCGNSLHGNREISPLTVARDARRPASGRPEGRNR
jgi:hypothetical protein